MGVALARSRRRNVTKTKSYDLEGGLDVVTSILKVRAGRALVLQNYEPWYNGGYRRLAGYERYDGQARPSDATFTGFDVSTVAGLTLRDVITGDNSGATGVLIGIWDDDGTYGADKIGVTKVVGTFVNGEPCNTSAFTIDSAPTLRESTDNDTEDSWLLEAQDDYRDDVVVVPGAGEVTGIWRLKANTFAWRDNVGDTASIPHKQSSSGWTTTGITHADTIRFDAGGGGGARALPLEGDTITGSVSGATAVVHRIVVHTGDASTDDAVGFMALTSVATGPFQNNEKLRVGGTDRADADGANSTYAFPIDGNYRFVSHNFFASSTTFRTYGVNGVGEMFELDENSVITPVLFPTTAMTGQPANNKPFLIEVHQNSIAVAFEGGIMQTSVVGEPLNFNGFLGAAEFGMGHEITGLNSVVGDVLVITTERESKGLYGRIANIGTASDDLQLKPIGERAGAKLNSVQHIDTVYALGDLGVINLARAQTFGDFQHAFVSKEVQPIVTGLLSSAVDSVVVKSSNQVRFYFSDNSGLVMYVPAGQNEEPQFSTISYPNDVKRIYASEDENGLEKIYFAFDDGFVYEDGVGPSFDGGTITAAMRLIFNNIGSPGMKKRFRRADVNLQSTNKLSLTFSYNLTYGAQDEGGPNISVAAQGGFWDVANWDEFEWDENVPSYVRGELGGSGTNISIYIVHDRADKYAFTLQGVTLHYDERRLQR